MKPHKAVYPILVILSLLFISFQSGFAGEGDNWPVYQGAWFQIKYPPDFRVKPSLKSRTSVDGYDSAFFASPGQEVEFYVFSPQWSGEPVDIELNPGREILISENFERDAPKNIRRVTVKDQEGTYLRSWVDTQDTMSNTRLVFGIKYKDQSAYNKYRKQYLIFKNSLKQFAD
jgi:hypothetical protein